MSRRLRLVLLVAGVLSAYVAPAVAKADVPAPVAPAVVHLAAR